MKPQISYHGRVLEPDKPAGQALPTRSPRVGALLLGPEGAFITGSDFLVDGGVTASYFYGPLAPDPTS